MKYNRTFKLKKDLQTLEKIKDTQVQIRINSEDKKNLIRISQKRNFKNLTDYILYLVMKDISQEEFKKLK